MTLVYNRQETVGGAPDDVAKALGFTKAFSVWGLGNRIHHTLELNPKPPVRRTRVRVWDTSALSHDHELP